MLVGVALSGCQPPAPAIDEERLARRVADMLAERFAEDGTCRPRGPNDSGDEQESDDSSVNSQSESQRQAVVNAMRAEADRLAQLAAQLGPAAPALPTVELAADRRATSSGDEAHRRTCIPLPAETPTLGPDGAIVTMVALLDPECPFSASLYPRILRAQRAYAQDVRLAVVLFPMAHHSNAPRASMALREVYTQQRSDGFFAYLSRLYATPRDLSVSALASYAEERNLDAGRFREAIEDGRHATFVATNLALATSTGARGTPALFVNGRLVVGAVSEEVLGGVLREELDRARRVRRTIAAARLASTLCHADASTTPANPARPMALPATPNGDTQ